MTKAVTAKDILADEENSKIINGVTEKDYDDDATTFFTILTENGETTSVWQTEFEGEILGYWDMNDEDFEILVHTNKYNI